MYTTLVSLAVFAIAALQVAAKDLQLSTPTLIQCKPAQISWGKTQGPYNLIVVPADAPCDSVLADLGDHDGTSMSWTANLAAGQKVLVSLEDHNGDEGWTQEITVGPSTDSSCLSPAQLAVGSKGAAAPTTDTAVGGASATAAAASDSESAPAAIPSAIQNAGAGSHAQATAVGAAGQGVIGGPSNGAAGLAASGALALGGALLAVLAAF